MNVALLGSLLAVAAVIGGAFGMIGVKLLSRDNDSANADQTRVQTLRDIITEVRSSEARKDQRIDELERRMTLLEERERHMLTRAAVHEAWDALAFQHISQGGVAFPPPPPLSVESEQETL